MSFWKQIFSDLDENGDGFDKVNGKFFTTLNEVNKEKITKAQWTASAQKLTNSINLPIGKVIDSDGQCGTCGTIAILGNGLCVTCWDYVVDHSSHNSTLWPSYSSPQ